jgi:beta-glucosidase
MKFSKGKLSKSDSVAVSFTLKNTGSFEGDEVVQLYIHDMIASVARPVLELKGFQRVHLKPGENKTVSFIITPAMLTMLDEKLKPVIEAGPFRIMIGSSSRNLLLKGNIAVKD